MTNKLSFRRFISVGLSAVFVLGLGTAAALWYSSRHAAQAARYLTDSVESIAIIESIQKNLSIHRRQALLRAIRTEDFRTSQREVAKAKMLESIYGITKYAESPEELAIVDKVQRGVLSYFLAHDSLVARGLTSFRLYEELVDDYDNAQEAIRELVSFNLEEARQMQAELRKQNTFDYELVATAMLLLAVAVLILVLGIRKLLYQPIFQLKRIIEKFEIGENLDMSEVGGAAEVGAIVASFLELSSKLSRQKELQLTFLCSIAHDLKNPLGAIRMSSEVLADDAAISAESRKMISVIGRQADHLLRLINDLLDTTRIESGHLELQFSKQDLRKILKDSVELYRHVSGRHRLNLQLPDAPLMALCDDHRLTQVFNNLLSNAIKYSPDGGNIDIRASQDRRFIYIRFVDRGIGIRPSEIDKIFEPFGRSSSKSTIPGIGLGLSTSRKIIRGHPEGEIEVTSKVGEGTEFVVKILSLNREVAATL